MLGVVGWRLAAEQHRGQGTDKPAVEAAYFEQQEHSHLVAAPDIAADRLAAPLCTLPWF